jgi:hypothetical protein
MLIRPARLVVLIVSGWLAVGCGDGELAAGEGEDATEVTRIEDVNPALLGP